jgi:glycosyltransferase involved in cell wall biosynthesis
MSQKKLNLYQKSAAASSSGNRRLRLIEPETKLPRIAIVIPAYNEEKNIEAVLIDIRALQMNHPDWEIIPIVVNDGSTDGTEELLKMLAPRYGIYIVNLPLNVGIGCTVQAGFQFAQLWYPDVTLQLDGDGQHPASQIPQIIQPILLGHADVVVGSRYVAGAGGNVSSSLRQAGTKFFSMLLKFLVGIKIEDVTSGFRAFNAEAATFIAKVYPDDYPEVETFVPLARREFRIAEVPVTMRTRTGGTSSITPIRSLYYMIKVMFATTLDVLRPLPPRKKKEEGKK